jgi:hypothetical protein
VATVLQFVDSTDLTTIRFDLNDSTGANNPNGTSTYFGLGGAFALMAPEPEQTIFSPTSSPGGRVVFSRDPLVRSSWRTRFKNTTYDSLVADIGELAQLLAQGGVLKYQANGSSNVRYIDFEPSPAPVLFNGTEMELFQATALFDTPQGVTLSILRQPYLRGAELDPALNLLTNATLLIDSGGNGTPDGWTHDAGTDSIVAAQEAYQSSHTAAVDLIHQDFSVGANGTYTVSGYARLVSGSGTGAIRVASVGGSGSSDSASITSSTWQRFTATVTTTGATTAIRVSLRQATASGTTVLQFRNVQLQTGSTASTFRCSAQTIANDPTTASGGRLLPIWIDGDALVPVKFKAQLGASSNTAKVAVASRLSHGVLGKRYLADLLNRSYFKAVSAGTKIGTAATVTDSTSIGGSKLVEQMPAQYVLANGNSTSPAATWPAATVSGSTLLACVFADFAGVNTTITPPAGWGSPIIANGTAGTTAGQWVYKIENSAVRSGAETFTLGAAKAWGIALVEVGEGGVVDQLASTASVGGTTTIASGTTATTTNATDCAIAFLCARVAGGAQTAPTNSFTQLQNTTANVSLGLYNRNVTATGAYSTACTITSAPWNGAIVTVKMDTPITAAHRVFRIDATTLLDSLRGTWDVRLRVKPGEASAWSFQLKWTASSGAAQNATTAMIRDWTGATSFASWVEIPLGKIRVPEIGTLQGLALELFVTRTSSSVANGDISAPPISFDSLILVPADDQVTSLDTVGGDSEMWLGSALTTPVGSPAGGTAGTVVGSALRIQTTQNAGAGSNSGTASFTAGRHVLAFNVTNQGNSSSTILCSLRNVTDGNYAASQTFTVPVNTTTTLALSATVVAGKAYQPQVDDPSATFLVNSITRTYAPTLAANQYVYSDPAEPGAHGLNSDGTIYIDLFQEGGLPVWLEPGLNLVHVTLLEAVPSGYSDEESVLTRTATLAPLYSPRYLG